MDQELIKAAQEVQQEIIGLGKQIHAEPELGFQEFKAMEACSRVLENHGFTVQRGVGSLKTAFKARYQGKKGDGPVVAFLAEYDCLPGIGHACGHNLIASAAVGAGVILSRLADRFGGRIVVMGTPAEEGGGGKVILLEEGAFQDIGYSLMMHPSTENLVGRGGRATVHFDIAFHGKSCHSSAPEAGINALNALLQLFAAIDNVRALLPTDANICGIITDGGKAANIIPDYARAEFSIRARSQADGDVIMDHLRHIIAAVEQLTGAKAEYHLERGYAERYPNDHIEQEIQKALEEQGEKVERAPRIGRYGSSDIGNVTLVMPAIHTYFKVAEPGCASHSTAFTEASDTEYAYGQMMKAAKAMAAAGLRLLTDEAYRKAVDEEFLTTVPQKQE